MSISSRENAVGRIHDSLVDARLNAEIGSISHNNGEIDRGAIDKLRELKLITDDFHEKLIRNFPGFRKKVHLEYDNALNLPGRNPQQAFAIALKNSLGVFALESRASRGGFERYLSGASNVDLDDTGMRTAIALVDSINVAISGLVDDPILTPSHGRPAALSSSPMSMDVVMRMERELVARKAKLDNELTALEDERSDLVRTDHGYKRDAKYLERIDGFRGALSNYWSNPIDDSNQLRNLWRKVLIFRANSGMQNQIENRLGWDNFENAWDSSLDSSFNKSTFKAFLDSPGMIKFGEALSQAMDRIRTRIDQRPETELVVVQRISRLDVDITKKREEINALDQLTFGEFFAHKAFGGMSEAEIGALSSESAADALIDAVVSFVNPGLGRLEGVKYRKLMKAKLLEDVQNSYDVDALSKRLDKAKDYSKLNAAKKIRFQRSVLQFKPDGSKSLGSSLGVTISDLRSEGSVQRLLDSGRLIEGEGGEMKLGYAFSLLVALEEDGGVTAQSEKLRKYLYDAVAVKLGADDRLDISGVQEVVKDYFDEQCKRCRVRYLDYKDKLSGLRSGNKNLVALKLKNDVELLLKKFRARQISDEDFQLRLQEWKDEVESYKLTGQIDIEKYEMLAKIWENPMIEKFLRSWGSDLTHWFGDRAMTMATATGKMAKLAGINAVVSSVKAVPKIIFKTLEYSGRAVVGPFTSKINGPFSAMYQDLDYIRRKATGKLTTAELAREKNLRDRKRERLGETEPEDKMSSWGKIRSFYKTALDDAKKLGKGREGHLEKIIVGLEGESKGIGMQLDRAVNVDFGSFGELEVPPGPYIQRLAV